MNTDDRLSTEEISRRISMGMGLVYDLFNELNSFFKLIRHGLETAEADLHYKGPKGFILGRSYKSSAERYVKTDLGLLMQVGGQDDEYEEDIDDQAAEEKDDYEDDENAEKKVDSTVITINPESRFIAIRAILYDPKFKDLKEFQPVVINALLGSLKRLPRIKKGKGKAVIESEFDIKAKWIIKLMKKLDNRNLIKGQELKAGVFKADLTATVLDVDINPLAEINSEEKVNELIDRIIAMIEVPHSNDQTGA